MISFNKKRGGVFGIRVSSYSAFFHFCFLYKYIFFYFFTKSSLPLSINYVYNLVSVLNVGLIKLMSRLYPVNLRSLTFFCRWFLFLNIIKKNIYYEVYHRFLFLVVGFFLKALFQVYVENLNITINHWSYISCFWDFSS